MRAGAMGLGLDPLAPAGSSSTPLPPFPFTSVIPGSSGSSAEEDDFSEESDDGDENESSGEGESPAPRKY